MLSCEKIKLQKAADSSSKLSSTQAGVPGTAATPSAGKGMPARSPRPQGPQTEHQPTPQDRAVEASVQLPHERDQSADMTAATPDTAVQQAAKDLQHGLSDTSKGAEMDKAYRKLGT